MKYIPVPQRQRGVNTLFVTLILLLLAGLVVFYTARGAITEQRLAANELRQKQAFAAAAAGLDHAMAYFALDGVDQLPAAPNQDHVADPISGATTLFSGTVERPSYYEVRYCAPGAAPPPCPATHTGTFACTAPLPADNLRNPLVVSCGWSDDDSAVVRLVQGGSRAPTLPGKITAPVVTKGTTNLLVGGASIFNYHNDLTVWAGAGVPTQSNTGKTFIRDITTDPAPSSTRDFRATGNSPACNNPSPGYTCSTDGNVSGHDLVINDTNLAGLNRDQFFAKFMTPPDPDAFRDSATWKVDLNNGITGEDSTNISSLTGKQDAVIWVEGNATGMSGTIGSVDRPVIMVINGDWNIGANPTIYGVVFVRGDVTGNGTPTIYGSLVSESASASGNIKVIYDPGVLGNATQLGKAGKVQGSWRDW